MSQYVTTPDGQRHKFPDEATPEQIKAALAGVPDRGASLTAHAPLPGIINRLGTGQLLPPALGAIGGLVSGVAGGLFTGPGGIPAAAEGAAYGGAIGEKLRRTLTHEPQSAAATGRAAAGQAALEAGGGYGMRAAIGLARPLTRMAWGVGKTLPGEVSAVESALGKGVSPEVSANNIRQLTTATGQTAAQLEDLVRASGRTFRSYDVVDGVRKLIASRVLPPDQKAVVASKLRQFVQQHGGTMDAPLLLEIKHFYQDEAKRAYEATSGPISPYARFSEALANGAQAQLEKIKGVADLERQTHGLSMAAGSAERAYKQPARTFELNKPGTWPVPVLTNPRVPSGLASKLADPRIQRALRQTPRSIVALLMQSAQPDATSQP